MRSRSDGRSTCSASILWVDVTLDCRQEAIRLYARLSTPYLPHPTSFSTSPLCLSFVHSINVALKLRLPLVVRGVTSLLPLHILHKLASTSAKRVHTFLIFFSIFLTVECSDSWDWRLALQTCVHLHSSFPHRAVTEVLISNPGYIPVMEF